MADEKKAPKSVDPASLQMIEKAEAEGISTIFDRADKMKACNIGEQGTCCKVCSQGPCRLPLPKKGIEGEDTRMGLCGATPNTIAARNFARMVAAGAAAHSDHGRGIAEVFLAAARGETEDYKIQDTKKLVEVARVLRHRGHGRRGRRREAQGHERDRRRARREGPRRVGQAGRARSTLPRGPQGTLRSLEEAGHHPPRYRQGSRRDHAPHPHGRGSGLQEHHQAVLPRRPGGRLGRLHDRYRPPGHHVRLPRTDSREHQPRRTQRRRGQHHHPRTRAAALRDDRGRFQGARDAGDWPRPRAPRASTWPGCAARPTRS